ncbi:MAG TPA: CHASE2 domain-containing protein [Chthonomonadaceae bacterium]|nr:CHASE2 domain-containing protein [Chthonomonadaceae bacterium]
MEDGNGRPEAGHDKTERGESHGPDGLGPVSAAGAAAPESGTPAVGDGAPPASQARHGGVHTPPPHAAERPATPAGSGDASPAPAADAEASAAAPSPAAVQPDDLDTTAIAGESRSRSRRAHRSNRQPETVAEARRRRLDEVIDDVKWAVVVICSLLALNLLLEQTELADRLKVLVFNAMQRRLPSGARAPVPLVQVVDISSLPGTIGHNLTDRRTLARLIEKIASQHPIAIGLDLDCSPQLPSNADELPTMTADEVQFLDTCLALSKSTPVFLGADRTATGSSSQWLYDAPYTDMAAALRTPTDERFTMWRSIRVKSADRELLSMSGKLASAVPAPLRPPTYAVPRALKWALTPEVDRDLSPAIRVEEFLVDYSQIEALGERSISIDDVMAAPAGDSRLRDRLVLIGNSSSETTDKMVVPDRTRAFPGVLVHASAAYTMLQSPLFQPTLPGRIAGDLLLGLLGIAIVVGRRLWHIHRGLDEPSEAHINTIHNVTTAVIFVSVIVAGIFLVQKTHVIWDDFPLVVVGLLFHRPVERLFKHLSGKIVRQASHGTGAPARPAHGVGSGKGET